VFICCFIISSFSLTIKTNLSKSENKKLILFQENNSNQISNMNQNQNEDPIGNPESKTNQSTVYSTIKDVPPRNKRELELYKFKLKLLSRSLFEEEDPRRKIGQKDFISKIPFSIYNLSRGEIEQIFLFADINRDDLIEQYEWDSFTELFILPFEACDDGDYILKVEDFKKCFEADPRSKLINFIDKYNNNKFDVIVDIVSSHGKKEMNFSDYLILRKALFGWKECQSSSLFLSLNSFKCAIKIVIPQKYHLKVDFEQIYNTGIKLNNDPVMVELDFVSYLRILYYTYVFSIFSPPQNVPYIDKEQFIKAVKEDRFPAGFYLKEVDYLFELINTNPYPLINRMNFETFCYIFYLNRLFIKHAKINAVQITRNELENLIEDPLFPNMIRLSIDKAISNLSEKQYSESSIDLKSRGINERDFYYSFKSIDFKENEKKKDINSGKSEINKVINNKFII